MSINFNHPNIKSHMLECEFGMEKESLRVTADGFLSHTMHPFPDNPHLERDFCENQTEIITRVWNSIEEVCLEMEKLQKEAAKTIFSLKSGRELFWPFSNPPYIKGDKDIPIAKFCGGLKKKGEYRRYLANKYGKKKMLFSGIHVNFSFPTSFLKAAAKETNSFSLQEFKNNIYLELAKKTARYSWLLIYLMAASPVMDGSYFKKEDLGKDVLKNYASPRCSEIGYWNHFIPIFNYNNLDVYIKSIQNYIDQGSLREAGELYYPVRLKPMGENTLDHLKENGVNHIELRMFDLNPLSPIGIKKEDLKFLHLFLLYLLSLEDEQWEAASQIKAVNNGKKAARYHNAEIETENAMISISTAALNILLAMEQFYDNMEIKDSKEIIYYQKRKIISSYQYRYAVRIRNQFQNNYVEKGLKLAKEYAIWAGVSL